MTEILYRKLCDKTLLKCYTVCECVCLYDMVFGGENRFFFCFFSKVMSTQIGHKKNNNKKTHYHYIELLRRINKGKCWFFPFGHSFFSSIGIVVSCGHRKVDFFSLLFIKYVPHIKNKYNVPKHTLTHKRLHIKYI